MNYTKQDIEQIEQLAYKRGATDTIKNILGSILFISMLYIISLLVVLI